MSDLLPFHTSDQRAIQASGPGAMVPAAAKEFTGSRMSEKEREAIIAKKVAGLTTTEIAASLGMSRNTVSAEVRRAEKDGRIPDAKQRMAEKLQDLTEEHLDLRLRMDAGKMSALDFAIYVDKGQLLQGAPTAIVSVARKEDEAAVLEDLKRLSEGFIDIDVTVVEPPTPPCLPNPPSSTT